MIKFSDRLGMFQWHCGSAIRCFVPLIVVHNLLYILWRRQPGQTSGAVIVVTFQAKKTKQKKKTEWNHKLARERFIYSELFRWLFSHPGLLQIIF